MGQLFMGKLNVTQGQYLNSDMRQVVMGREGNDGERLCPAQALISTVSNEYEVKSREEDRRWQKAT